MSDTPLAFTRNYEAEASHSPTLRYHRVAFASCPTGAFCREDRCQSFFSPGLIPTMRAPLEECEAAGALRALRVQHRIIDAPAERLADQDFIATLLKFKPDLLILAVTFGSLEHDLRWARKLRELLPSLPIGIRGAPCYSDADAILARRTAVDFCMRGDYELVTEELVSYGIDAAAGIIFRKTDGSIQSNPAPYADHLDDLPHPDRSGIRRELYRVRGIGRPQATIRVQRGCPFPCTYCLVHAVSGGKVRHRSAENIVEEMAALMADGIRYFYLRAETFSLDKNWAQSLCALIAERCPQARWVTTTRVECVDEDTIAAMRRAGCYGISFGVDVASADIGKKVRKPPQKEAATEAMRLCDRHGIISLAYFMVGFIWETRATLAESLEFMRSIRPDLLTIHFAHPYPGTPYHQAVQNAGLSVDSMKAQAEPALPLGQISTVELQRFARRALRSHYTRPAVFSSLTKKLFNHFVQGNSVA